MIQDNLNKIKNIKLLLILLGGVYLIAIIPQIVSLANTDLKNSNLEMIEYDDNTNWQNAKYNKKTIFPEEFYPREQGMILVRSPKK